MNLIRKITAEEVESYRVKSFNEMDEMLSDSCKLRAELQTNYCSYQSASKDYEQLKIEEHERLKIHLGKGKYYSIVSKPTEINDTLETLKQNIYDSYTGQIDLKSKQKYELQEKILLEDLKIAKEELKQFEEESLDISQKCIEANKKCRQLLKRIRQLELKIASLEKARASKLSDVKKLEHLYEKGIPVFVKKYIK